jgi:hypothetical protein
LSAAIASVDLRGWSICNGMIGSVSRFMSFNFFTYLLTFCFVAVYLEVDISAGKFANLVVLLAR